MNIQFEADKAAGGITLGVVDLNNKSITNVI